MDEHDAFRIAAALAWQLDRQARKQQKRDEKQAIRDWNVAEHNRRFYEQQEAAQRYYQSPEYARDQAIARIENEKREQEQKRKREFRRQERAQQAKHIINNPSLHAHDVYLINQLLAMGFPQPTYYGTNTFAFFLPAERNEQYGTAPIVWTWLDDNDTCQVTVREYYHPQMKEINQAVAGWRRGQTQYEPPTNAAWLLSSLRGFFRGPINTTPQKSAHDVALINRLMALGLDEPTYYGANTFAFWHGKQPIVWTYLDENKRYRITPRNYGHPRMEEINQAVAEWRMANGDDNENE